MSVRQRGGPDWKNIGISPFSLKNPLLGRCNRLAFRDSVVDQLLRHCTFWAVRVLVDGENRAKHTLMERRKRGH